MLIIAGLPALQLVEGRSGWQSALLASHACRHDGAVCTLQLDKDAVSTEDNGVNTKTRSWSVRTVQWKHVERSRRVIGTAAQSGTRRRTPSAEQLFNTLHGKAGKAGKARLIALKTVLF